MPEAQFCPQCGQPAEGDARFCKFCGASLEADSRSLATGPLTATVGRGRLHLPRSRGTRVLLLGVLLTVVAVAVAIPLFLLNGGDDHQGARTAAQEVTAESDDTDGDGVPDGSDPNPYAANDSGQDPEEEEGLDEEDATEPVQTTVGLQEGAKDDGLGFKVLSIEQVGSVSPRDDLSSEVHPRPGGGLYKAMVEVKNYGKTAMDPFCGGASAVLLDEEDRNFEPVDATDTNGWVCLDGVAPGFNEQAVLAFHVPRGFKLGGMVLWNSDSADVAGDESNIAVLP